MNQAPEATAESLKDPSWRKRVGFDSIMGPEDLALEVQVVEARCPSR